jgi:maleate isomerase
VWDHGKEYSKLSPEGVKSVVATLGAVSFDRDNMAEVRAQRRSAAELLEEKGADCIIAGGVPVSTLDGPNAEDDFIRDISNDLTIPFTTSSRCAIDALNRLETDRIVLVTPFPDERDEELVNYFESHGMSVVGIGGSNVPDPHDVRGMPENTFYRETRETIAEIGSDFDAVYVPCVPYGSVSHISTLEEDVGKPVVTSAQAQVFSAFEMGNVHPTIEGFGTLLQDYL